MKFKNTYLQCLWMMCLVCPVIVLGEYSYVFGHRYLPICLLPAGLVGLLMIPRDDWGERWRLLRQFVLPFTPWVISVLLVVVLQGRYRGLHNYAYMLGVFSLLFFIFCRGKIDKESIPCALLLTLFFIFCRVVFGVFSGGVSQDWLHYLTINQNCLMGGVLILTVVCFAWGFQSEDSVLRAALWIATMLGIVSITILQVRCCLLGLGALFFAVFWSVRRRFRIWGLVGVLFFLGIAGSYFWYTGRLSMGFSDVDRWLRGDANSSWGIRLELWKTTLCGLQVHPFIGWGIDPLRGIFASGVCSTPLWGLYDIGTHMHNDFFNSLARGGIIGCVGWLAMQIGLFVNAKKSVVRRSMLIGVWLGGIGEIYWPYCMYVAYAFMCLWFLLSVYELQNDFGECLKPCQIK